MRVIPVPLLALFTGSEVEVMACGSPDIPLSLLKSVSVIAPYVHILWVCRCAGVAMWRCEEPG